MWWKYDGHTQIHPWCIWIRLQIILMLQNIELFFLFMSMVQVAEIWCRSKWEYKPEYTNMLYLKSKIILVCRIFFFCLTQTEVVHNQIERSQFEWPLWENVQLVCGQECWKFEQAVSLRGWADTALYFAYFKTTFVSEHTHTHTHLLLLPMPESTFTALSKREFQL